MRVIFISLAQTVRRSIRALADMSALRRTSSALPTHVHTGFHFAVLVQTLEPAVQFSRRPAYRNNCTLLYLNKSTTKQPILVTFAKKFRKTSALKVFNSVYLLHVNTVTIHYVQKVVTQESSLIRNLFCFSFLHEAVLEAKPA